MLINVANAYDAMHTALMGMAGESVTYSRGATELDITALVGDTRTEQTLDGGQIIDSRVRDFLVDADDITDLDEPQAGDRIRQTIGSTVYIFEAMEVAGEVWRWSDPQHNRYRIHVRFVGTEAAST